MLAKIRAFHDLREVLLSVTQDLRHESAESGELRLEDACAVGIAFGSGPPFASSFIWVADPGQCLLFVTV